MERADRFKKAFEYLRYSGLATTQMEVAQKMGSQRSNVSSALNGNDKYLTDSLLKKFNVAFGNIFDVDWLMTGEGSMLKGGGGSTPMPTETLPDGAVNMERGVPYYDVDFIGGFDLVFNAENAHPEYYIDHPIYNKADCWCNVSGHSMEPVISHGDTIALKRVQDWADFLPFGEIYAIVTEEHRTIKRVTRSDRGDDFFTLVPENKAEEYRAQDIPKRLITHVFKVLGAVKRF